MANEAPQSQQAAIAARGQREVEHGIWLASGDPEDIWGWSTPAGKLRARRRADLIAEAAGLGPGVKALEIGCGTGNFTQMFAESGATIVAVDISAELLTRARQRNLPTDRVYFLCKGFEQCDIDGPFDAVIGSSVLHHLEMPTTIEKCFSLLKPGGRFSFAEPNMLNPQIFFQKNLPWLKRSLGDSPDETAIVRWRFARELARHGFVDVSVTPYDWLHPRTPGPLVPPVRGVGRVLERIPVLREFAGSVIIRARKPVG